MFGLVGEKLAHSYSQRIHALLGNPDYQLIPLDAPAFDNFIRRKQFSGINVTIPYKRDVLAYCDMLDPLVQRIGAANTVVNHNGQLHAYNTDYAGMDYALKSRGINPAGKSVLILGNGGTAATACALMQDIGARKIIIASRAGADIQNDKNIIYTDNHDNKTDNTDGKKMPLPLVINYNLACKCQDIEIIINTTPVGMYPQNGEQAIELAVFPRLKAVMDTIYNPLKTALLQQAEHLGVPCVNGLGMLVAQAVATEKLFALPLPGANVIQNTMHKVMENCCNIVLVGMPGVGKTYLGSRLAERLGRTFQDIDSMVEREAGRTISALFKEKGEAHFRDLEEKAAKQAGKASGTVIAAGGGTTLRDANLQALRQNGVLVYLKQPLEALQISSKRPLASSREALNRLAEQRLPHYEAVADVVVDIPQNVEDALIHIETAFKKCIVT